MQKVFKTNRYERVGGQGGREGGGKQGQGWEGGSRSCSDPTAHLVVPAEHQLESRRVTFAFICWSKAEL